MKIIFKIFILFFFSPLLFAQDAEVLPLSIGNRWIYLHTSVGSSQYDRSESSPIEIKEVVSETISDNLKIKNIKVTILKDSTQEIRSESWKIDSSRFFIRHMLCYDSEIMKDTRIPDPLDLNYSIDIKFDSINLWGKQGVVQIWDKYPGSIGVPYWKIKTSDIFGPIELTSGRRDILLNQWDFRVLIGCSLDGVSFGEPTPPFGLILINNKNKITLRWDKNPENNILRYRIYTEDSFGNFSLVDSTNSVSDTTMTLVKLFNLNDFYFRVTAVNNSNLESYYSTRSKFIDSIYPDKTILFQNYPNPFNKSTNITYDLKKTQLVSVKIYNSIGKVVKVLVNEYQKAGSKKVIWDGLNNEDIIVGSGIYFVHFKTDNNSLSKRLIFLK